MKRSVFPFFVIAMVCASLSLLSVQGNGTQSGAQNGEQQTAQSGTQNPPPITSKGFEEGPPEGSIGIVVIPCRQRPTQPRTHIVLQSAPQDVAAGALPSYEFEGTSIVPHDPANEQVVGRARIISRTGAICDGFGALNVTVRSLIQIAFGVDHDKIVGTPGWVNDDNYDFTINFSPATADAMNSLQPGAKARAEREALIPFLADRLKLEYHRETKLIPVYELVLGKKGPKFHESAQPNTGSAALTVEMDSQGGYVLTGRGARIDTLCVPLEKVLERNVVDKTGLTGFYDFTLTYQPQVQHYTSLAQMSAAPIAAAYKASVLEGVDKQLGLKLESSTGPVEVIVIDHIEKPGKN
ncbi:MAG: TIGR03435 family protein [Candidatus Acidiferrales bacterium]